MNRIIACLAALLVAGFSMAQEKREVLVKKYFRNSDTFVIECRGYPKEGLTGKAAVESAREAALTNAQFIAGEIFKGPVNAVKDGTAEKYSVRKDHVIIRYVVRHRGLKGFSKKK